ncbi:unnamed protein product [Gongylonema pulchrum]|uniref:Aa_trans domain-containing protein n=1 Tax=Gongylonema pulchrum TaxID=637853 RepID=A0A183EYD8_9BILA|nr:unnamed protein product [Gongylonema pulchrum]
MGGDAKHDTSASGGQVKSNKMGLLGAISYIIGNIVGAGLFVTPTSVLEQVDTQPSNEEATVQLLGCGRDCYCNSARSARLGQVYVRIAKTVVADGRRCYLESWVTCD